MRVTSDPKFIHAANIRLGDTIRVEWPQRLGLKETATGTVHSREYEGSDRVLKTREGGVILVWNPARKPPRIILLQAAEDTAETLPGMET